MARSVNIPVKVVAVPWSDGRASVRPAIIYRPDRSRIVVKEVQDCWREAGRWWEQEAQVTVWRVRAWDGGVYEVARADGEPPQWRILKIWD